MDLRQVKMLEDAVTEYINFHVREYGPSVERRINECVKTMEKELTPYDWSDKLILQMRGRGATIPDLTPENHPFNANLVREKKDAQYEFNDLKDFNADAYIGTITSSEFRKNLTEYLSNPQNFISTQHQEEYWGHGEALEEHYGGNLSEVLTAQDDELQCFLDNTFGMSVEKVGSNYIPGAGNFYTPRDSLIIKYMREVVIPQCRPELVEEREVAKELAYENHPQVSLYDAISSLLDSYIEGIEERHSLSLKRERKDMLSFVSSSEEGSDEVREYYRNLIPSVRDRVIALKSFNVKSYLDVLMSDELKVSLGDYLSDPESFKSSPYYSSYVYYLESCEDKRQETASTITSFVKYLCGAVHTLSGCTLTLGDLEPTLAEDHLTLIWMRQRTQDGEEEE
jgi:hypothetical protein